MADYREYDSLLENCKDENEVQEYLEKNGHLIPVYNWLLGHQVHCAFIISKFRLGNEYVTDFTYMTKCSDEWYVVFVEIENPKKKIFTKNDHFTSDFNKAYEQVENWERYLKDSNHRIQILNSLKNLRHSRIMHDENVTFKYLLIYGRKGDRDVSDERRNKFFQKKTIDIRVCTFDSIKSAPNQYPDYMVLVPRGEDKYKIKYVPQKYELFDQGFFSYVRPEHIILEGESLEELKKQGYEINYWRKGIPLTINIKYHDDSCITRTDLLSH